MTERSTSTAPQPDEWLDGLLRQAARADEPADDGFSDAVLRALPAAALAPVSPAAPAAQPHWGAAFWRPVLNSLGLALLLLCAAALWPQWQTLWAWGSLLAQQPTALADPRLTTQWLEPLLALAAPAGLWLWWSLSLGSVDI
ncbi:hypothetical protein [Ideonella paludis]|uniref:ABC transporter permease n=1 Tax=Ideonella paludis TaxID=1233411 RepID=A0ABS5DTR1_9BURK|nr:hypothetical protein [Ideonella paludis]MBQ0934500.1 hypothetical protein [Ideonella paludis]